MCVYVGGGGGGGVCMSLFYINLYISFIHEDIFTKFAENRGGGGGHHIKRANISVHWP